jgi:hypothetical protein
LREFLLSEGLVGDLRRIAGRETLEFKSLRAT